MNVTVIGPNLPRPLCDKGTFHVHAAGCADIKRTYRRYRLDPPWTIEAATVLDVIGSVYDPSNFDYDLSNADDRSPYETDIYFLPCTNALPYESVEV